MNHVKDENVGVDIVIRKLQIGLYAHLESNWNSSNIDGYGRIYRNPKNDRIIPEFYIKKGEYREVLMSDMVNSIFFFDVNPDISINTGAFATANVDIIVYVDLKSIYGDYYRKDEEARNQVISYFSNKPYDFRTQRITHTIDNVYSEFKGVAKTLKNKDMSRYHHFKLSGTLTYQSNNCKK